MTKIIVEIPDKVHKKLKHVATDRKTSVKEIVNQACDEWLVRNAKSITMEGAEKEVEQSL